MATFQLGNRVRTTVDAPPVWEGAWGAPAGTLGTITTTNNYEYGVLLDGDPDQLPAAYSADEIELV